MLYACTVVDSKNNSEVWKYDSIENRLYTPEGEDFRLEDSKQTSDKRITVRISIGKECNLRCKYCFQATDRNCLPEEQLMPQSDLVREIKRVINGREMRMIQLWGGEPLLYYDKFTSLYKDLKEVFPNVMFSTVTNGTLLDRKWADFFINSDFIVSFSYDGPGQHVRGPDILSDSKIKALITEIYQHKPNQVSFNPTISKDNLDLVDYINHIERVFGTKDIGIGEGAPLCVMDEAGYEYRVPEKYLPEYYRRLQGYLIADNVKRAGYLMRPAYMFLNALGFQPTKETKCFVMSENFYSFDLAGNVLICPNFGPDYYFENTERLYRGHITSLPTGAPAPRAGLLALRARQNTRCIHCVVRTLCQGACPYAPLKYEDYNCKAMFSHCLAQFGHALYLISGGWLSDVKKIDE